MEFRRVSEAVITTANVITFHGADYEIPGIDTFEGCKEDSVLYCKAKS